MQHVYSVHYSVCAFIYSAKVNMCHNISNLPPSDDYNRVLLKLDEGRSRDSDPDEDDEEESSDEEDEESTKYINASHIDVRYFTDTFSLFTNLFLYKTDIKLDARTEITVVCLIEA